MRRILTHWRTTIYLITGVKILAILLVPIGGDFMSWTIGGSEVLQVILRGSVPTLSRFGVYLGIELVLAPFFWIWTILPIEHPQLKTIVQHTLPAVSLGFFLKLPILIFDVLTLILLMRLVRHLTSSERCGQSAGLTWFLNPFNFYMLYFFGAMDIIPIAIFLLGLNFGLVSNWFRCGLATIAAGFLRLYSFATLPFFFPLLRTRLARSTFLVGCLLPLGFAVAILYLSGDSLTTVFSVPAKQSWLLEFLGYSIGTMQYVKLSPVLVIVQLYIVFRFWRPNANIVHLVSVSLLALLLGSTVYAGGGHHFFWVSPLLSASLAMHPEESWIFGLTFLSALISPTVNPFGQWTPDHPLVDTFLSGVFYATMAAYLTKLNLSNLHFPR